MIRREISLFMNNVPGELGKMTALLSDAGINVDAITIQDASSYIQNIFEARGKSIKRLASAASYSYVKRDSAQVSLIRMLVDKSDEAVALLNEKEYVFDTKDLIAIELDNTPGTLSQITRKLGEEEVNINYIYGSVSDSDGKCLFVFCPEDLQATLKIFESFS
ncbi:MAG: amino acid-binding protein [Desulfobacterium sp.]